MDFLRISATGMVLFASAWPMAFRRRRQDGVHPSGPAKGAEKVDKREGEGPYPKGLPSWPGRGKGSKGEGAGLEREGERGKRWRHVIVHRRRQSNRAGTVFMGLAMLRPGELQIETSQMTYGCFCQ